MRVWIKYLLGTVAVVLVAGYAEFIMDFRGPRSQLKNEGAFAAVTSTSYGNRDAEFDKARAKYGSRVQAHDDVSAGSVDGKWTISLDGNVLEEGRIITKLAGMYGLLAVTSDDTTEGIFPFSIMPGSPGLSDAGSVKSLRNRFPNFPARFLQFADADLTFDSCAVLAPSELGFGPIGPWLGMQAQTYCVAHWKGEHPSSMLISVTLANGDPWMRLFARWVCRSITSTTLSKLVSPGGQPPAYAACVLVDRPDRRKPRDAHETFASIVYEIRDSTPARMN